MIYEYIDVSPVTRAVEGSVRLQFHMHLLWTLDANGLYIFILAQMNRFDIQVSFS